MARDYSKFQGMLACSCCRMLCRLDRSADVALCPHPDAQSACSKEMLNEEVAFKKVQQQLEKERKHVTAGLSVLANGIRPVAMFVKIVP